ncbi:hypothetical protein ABE867_16840 [Enterococcus gallinarum]|uniref:hypothetical protein n=1 Tax=Enterococcus gallinarum TaxID=1353 RepID=UPI003D6A9771
MKKNYIKIQFISGLYTVIYLSALYFATGVGTGFKLDDNQLTGYILCGISLLLLFFSFFTSKIKSEKNISILFFLCCFSLLIVTVFNIVSFNESFWYFIFFIYLIPFIELFNVISFFRGS